MTNETLRHTLSQQRQDAIARKDWDEYQRLTRQIALLPMQGVPDLTLAQLHAIYSGK